MLSNLVDALANTNLKLCDLDIIQAEIWVLNIKINMKELFYSI
jgi:hypothetical protein